MSFLYFIILIGVLIFVHELGHFVVARIFDVKVLRFSIGFGPALMTIKGEETEYLICVLPLGGYVQMQGADLESTEDLPEEEQARSLMAKPIWQRSLIVLAGPVANLILPAIIYFVFGLVSTTTAPSMIGQVWAESVAEEAGLEAGDRIVAIDGREVAYFHQVARYINASPDQEVELTFERYGELHTTTVVPEKYSTTDFLGLFQESGGRIGIGLGTPGPTIAIADREGAAARDGLQFFDRVVAIDGEVVERFDEIKTKIVKSDGEPLEFLVLSRSDIPSEVGNFYHQDKRTVTVTPDIVDGVPTLGIEPSAMYLARIDEDGPAARAGFKAGDKIVALDGRRFDSWSLFGERLSTTVNEMIVERDEAGEDYEIEARFEVEVRRNGELVTLHYEPDVVTYTDDTNQTHYRVEHGWDTFRDTVFPEEIHHPLGQRFVHSARMGIEETWDYTKLMVVGLVRLVQGRISTESIGGPIMIGELAAEAGHAGIEPFLRMLALISINLAIINLLPIPILDGGRLVLFALEAIKRKPLSYRTRQIAAYIGLVLILMLMVLAFKNDIERNWYRVVEIFEQE